MISFSNCEEVLVSAHKHQSAGNCRGGVAGFVKVIGGEHFKFAVASNDDEFAIGLSAVNVAVSRYWAAVKAPAADGAFAPVNFAGSGIDTSDDALVIPEDTPYEVCIRNMPLDGGRLQMDPFAAERFKIYNPNAGTKKKKKGVKKKGKKKDREPEKQDGSDRGRHAGQKKENKMNRKKDNDPDPPDDGGDS